MTRTQQWRQIANSFHRIAHQVAKGNLPSDFEAIRLRKEADQMVQDFQYNR